MTARHRQAARVPRLAAILAASLALAPAAGCRRGADQPAPPASSSMDSGHVVAADATARQAASPGVVTLVDAGLRLAPSPDAVVPSPLRGGPPVTNVIGLLRRGTALTVTGRAAGYVAVRRADGAEGWLADEHVVDPAAVPPATLLAATPYYAAAEASMSAGTLPAAALLYVRPAGTGTARALVEAEGLGAVWVDHGALSQRPADVAVSQLIAQARTAKPTKAAKLLAAAQRDHRGSPLLAILATTAAARAAAVAGQWPPVPPPR